MKNFAYQIEEELYTGKTIVSIYDGCKEILSASYKAEIKGLNLPVSGMVVDGLHYPDSKFGDWRWLKRSLPTSKEIPAGINLHEGNVTIALERSYTAGIRQTLSEVRENRGTVGSEEEFYTVIEQGGKETILPLILEREFRGEFYAAHGKLWNKKPGTPAPKWVLGLI